MQVKLFRPMFLLAALACAFSLAGVRELPADERPNVVIIYGDDVGFGDLGVNGASKIPTPNLDRLAAEGLNFTDGHCPASTCSASRYAMLTGVLAHRKNVRVLGPTAPMIIGPEEYTLPKLFKQAGYATAVIGKWHLGLGAPGVPTDWNGEVKPGPLEIGFDYAFLLPNTNDRVPCVYLENYRVVNLDPADPISIGEREDPRSTAYPDGRVRPEAMTYYRSSHGHNQSVIGGIGRIGTMFGGKYQIYEGGTRVPLIVRWPKRIKPGTSAALVTQTDFLASFAKLLDGTLPPGAARDSQEHLAALLGEDPAGASYIVEEAGGYALRAGDWKLVRHPPRPKRGNRQGGERGKAGPRYELYNLAEDIGERTDLAARHPEKVAQLGALLERIVQGAGVRETFQAAANP